MKFLRYYTNNKLSSFTLIETIIALIISGVVVLMAFNLLVSIQTKLADRKENSVFFSTRAIENYYHELDLLKNISKAQNNANQNKYFTVSEVEFYEDKEDTLSIQLLQTEIQKFNNGF